MERRHAAVVLSLSLVALLPACASSASRDEQMEYLRTMAQHGAELHAVLKSQGDAGDGEKCEAVYADRYDGPHGDAPHVEDDDERVALLKRGEGLFIESCLSGTPSPVSPQGDPASPSALPAPGWATAVDGG